ncbi:MAG: hypothetical protein IPG21_08410 [Saprospiraceae bacterium]|nr:hypothetical protein [Candidatus Vicinibacter affinis]
MKRYFLLLLIILFNNTLFSQIQSLQKYIEEGKNFNEIYRKADKMIRRHKLEEKEYRDIYRKSKSNKDHLDNERLRLERWAWYWRDRLNEDGSFPDISRQHEIYRLVNQTSKKQTSREEKVWKHEGPVRNTGGYWGMGRTTHIDFHPTQQGTFYVAAPNGGLWKTTNGGLNYVSLGEDLPQQPVGIVIVDQKNPNNIFISLGEKEGWWQYGLGVYKSTDGGISWKATGLNWKLTDNKVLYGLEMNSKNSNILIAATNDGLYKTFNGGTSWIKIRNENFSDVKYHPTDTSIVYAAINDYWGSCEILKSIDGGKSWNQVSSFATQKSFLRLAVTLAAPSYLGVNASVDGAKKFFLSKDLGASFKFISDMPENLVMCFSQQNADIMYCGYVVLYKSNDGGVTWTKFTHWHGGTEYPEIHADHHYVASHPKQKQDLYFCNDGGVHKYDENTDKWTELVNGLAITQFYKMAVSNSTPAVLIGGSQDNGGYIRRANGNWGNTNGGDAMWQLIDPTNPNIGYTEYWGGTAVYRTTNGFYDLTEISVNVPGDPQGQWVTPFVLNPKNPKTFIIGYHEVFASHNRGNSFVALSKNLTGGEDKDLRNVVMSPIDTNTILASYSNIVYHTRDYGKNWSKTTVPLSLDVTGIEFHSKDTNRIWITRGGLGTIKVMESKDRGKTWGNVTKNFVNTPALCVTFDETSNLLFVGTDIGVFYSDVNDFNWKYYGVDLPNTSVTDIDLHRPTRKMYISTYGRGFYSIDLPDCYPAEINVQASTSGDSFKDVDTLKICLGQSLKLKSSQESLTGTFQWIGPLGLDTVISNYNILDLGKITTFSKAGVYVLDYLSPSGCNRSDTFWLKVYSNPVTKITSDYTSIDCRHGEIILSHQNPNKDFKQTWSFQQNSFSDSAAVVIKEEGTYKLTILNALTGCSASDSIYIRKFISPNLSYTKEDLRCFGDSTGKIELKLSGGTQPIILSYSDARIASNPTNLTAGIYKVTAKDSIGCISEVEIKIIEPAEIRITTMVTHTSGNEGKIVLDVTGGTPPYLFKWYKENVEISNSKDLENLNPGIYEVVVTDSLGCIYRSDFITINNSTGINTSSFGEIYLYPTPAKDKLVLHFDQIPSEPIAVDIIGLGGQIMFGKEFILNTQEFDLNLKSIQAGYYKLIIRTKSQTKELRFEVVK